MNKQTTFLEMLEFWLSGYLPDEEGKRFNTIKSYRDSWRLMIQFMYEQKSIPADKITFSSLDYEMISDFLQWLQKERRVCASTRNTRLAAITKFSEYAQNRNFSAASCFRSACIKFPYKKLCDAKERSYFTQEETQKILALPDVKDQTGYRDQVILSVMYASGMRADELCNLTVGDINFPEDGRASILIHGKGGKSRRIKISTVPSGMLKKYIAHRKISNRPDRHVFSTQRNEQMSVSALEEIFSKYVSRAKEQNDGLFLEKNYTPHSMRHTTAVHMVEAGIPLIVIKQFLGHSSLTSTEVYAKLSQSKVNERLKDWDEKYWNDTLIDSLNKESVDQSKTNIPDFLK